MASSLSLLEQVTALQSEIAQLQSLVRASQHDNPTQEQTVAQRRNLNAINPPINRMPLETISTIFLYAISPPPPTSNFESWELRRKQINQRDPADVFLSITLGAVCSSWRRISLSTPLLWTHFEYPETLWKHSRDCRYTLSLYLQNSKHLPIHLSLAYPYEPDESDKSLLWHSSFDRMLISNLSRIHTLTLLNPPLPWFSQLKSTPFVTDLSIDCDVYIQPLPDRLSLHKCRALSRLALFGVYSHVHTRILYHVPSSLTVLDISMFPVDTCIKVMLRCPNLVEAYIQKQEDAEESASYNQLKNNWFSKPVVFQRLEIFLWGTCDFIWADEFLHHLRTPVLRVLELTGVSDGELKLASAGETHFINQIPPTLKTLRISSAFYIELDSFGHLLNHNSSIEHLVVQRCDKDVLVAIFRLLLPSSSRKGRGSYMARLRSLAINSCSVENDGAGELTADELGPLVEALVTRLTKGDTFNLELQNFGVDWTPGMQEKLCELVEGGVQLEVIEDLEPVDWLRSRHRDARVR